MIEVLSSDKFLLPQAMLAEVKSFCRVSHCDDDQQILLLIGAAISQYERTKQMTINPVQLLWTVDSAFNSYGQINITPEKRISPISLWTAAADAGNVTASYSLVSYGLHGVTFYSLSGAEQPGLALTIDAGYASLDLMPPDIRFQIARSASTFYEYRERFTPANLIRHPDVENIDEAGYWIPSV